MTPAPTCATCRHYTVTIGPIITLGRIRASYSVGRCHVDAEPKPVMSTGGCGKHERKAE